MKYKHALLSFTATMHIAFGLGSLPECPVTDGGLLVIGFYDEKPTVNQRVTNDRVFLFSFEL